MTDRFHQLTAALEANLRAHPGVRGLILLGSTAGTLRQPDAHSDHDFFVVADDDRAEALRTDLSWVPDHARLILVHRETAHGLKLLFDDGHVMELAVFTAAELVWARGDTWRVVFAEGLDLEAIMQANAARPPEPADPAWLARQALFLLRIGAGRWQRGERLAGHRMVLGDALPKVVEVLARLTPRTGEAVEDPLDPLRRFERARPELGARLGEALTAPADRAAVILVGVLAEALRGRGLVADPVLARLVDLIGSR